MNPIVLHGYFRSSTSFRARMALNLKGVEYQQVTHHLRKNEQQAPDYLALNPQGLVPSLVWSDGTVHTQSMAIIEFVDEMVPGAPLMPTDPHGRARVRALTQVIGCDIHPLNNLRVLQAIKTRFGADEAATADWFRHWVTEAFGPLEQMLKASPHTGQFCHGNTPTMADIALVSQVINNKRYDIALDDYPTIARIFKACMAIPAIERALPHHQPDAEA